MQSHHQPAGRAAL